MEELVPLKIKIGRKTKDGQRINAYPDFNSLPGNLRGDMDWSYFIDQFGTVKYDKKCGFGEADNLDQTDPHNNTDPKCQYCAFLVPIDFATAALAMFPNEIVEMDEDTWEKFYDERAHIHMSEELVNTDIVNAIAAKKNAGISLTQNDLDALDSTKDTPGIVKNKDRLWADHKTKRKVKIVKT